MTQGSISVWVIRKLLWFLNESQSETWFLKVKTGMFPFVLWKLYNKSCIFLYYNFENFRAIFLFEYLFPGFWYSNYSIYSLAMILNISHVNEIFENINKAICSQNHAHMNTSLHLIQEILTFFHRTLGSMCSIIFLFNNIVFHFV